MRKKSAIVVSYGWPLNDASMGAALLRGLRCNADVFPRSSAELVPFLEHHSSKYGRVFIVNIPFSGDAEHVVAMLKELKRHSTEVEWCANCVGRKKGELARRLHDNGLISYITGDGSDLHFLRDVSTRFGVDLSDLSGLGDLVIGNMYCVTDVPAMNAVEAGVWFHESYGRDDVYDMAVGALAEKQIGKGMPSGLQEAIEHYCHFKRRGLLGKSAAMENLRCLVKKASQAENAKVMILGESGTGKETVAMQIHYGSTRRKKKFVPFNCATTNVELVESRLFGHEKGSFTGADKQKIGLFEEANGGTLFLDEIGELKPEVQGILLRVLEDGRIMRVGGNEEIPVDVRLITATNRNLPQMVAEGRFRADLFQRLCVLQIEVPPLRAHKEDIADIVHAWYNLRQRPNAKYVEHPSDEQIAALMDYDYPGNVRELLNLLERADALGETDFGKLLQEHKRINAGLMANIKQSEPMPPKVPKAETDDPKDSPENPERSSDRLEDAIRAHVRRVYEKYGRNLTRAAEVLGLSRNTVRKHLEQDYDRN